MKFHKKVLYFLLSLIFMFCISFSSFAQETSAESSEPYTERTENEVFAETFDASAEQWSEAPSESSEEPDEWIEETQSEFQESTSYDDSDLVSEESDSEISGRILDQAVAYATIDSCTITGSDQISVRFSISEHPDTIDNKLYLFELKSYENSIGSKQPIASIDISSDYSNLQFQVSLNPNTDSSRLYSKFVIGIAGSSYGYVPIHDMASYITNPEALAQYTYAFPTASSKKGLMVNSGMLSDMEDLGANHAVLNIELNQLVSNGDFAYTYNGKTYHLNSGVINSYDSFLKKVAQNNVIVTGILLAKPSDVYPELTHPDASDVYNANYYALNASTPEGIECITALTHFLAERYSREDKAYGQIVNWVVGNEVNNSPVWNNMGNNPNFDAYVQNYSHSIRAISTAVKSVNACSRIYVSLDHYWNSSPENRFNAGNLLTSMQDYLNSEGAIPWNIAYHPYPTPLVNPDFTDDPVTNDISTPIITFKNLSVLTNFLQGSNMLNPDKSVKRTILSEQGFSSVNEHGQDVSETQAVMLAYAYYIVDSNPYIDSLILSRHVDHPIEVAQNINFGLWDTNLKDSSGENPLHKKESWEIYKYIDTSQSLAVTAPILERLGAGSWNDLISGFKSDNYNNLYSIAYGPVSRTLSLTDASNIPSNWKNHFYTKINNVLTSGADVSIESTYNAAYKCIIQDFDQPLDFSSKSVLGLNITVNGLPTDYARVRIRLFNGDNVCDGEALVAAGEKTALNVDISKWAFRNNITKMQIWVKQDGNAQWTSGSFLVEDIVQAASAVSQSYITLNNASASSPSANSYYVSCNVYSSASIDRVEFKTWNNSNASHSVTQTGTIYGQDISCRINISSIRGGKESYTTTITAYDSSGLASKPISVSMELGKPILSDIMVTNVTSSGYKVTCNVTSIDGITKVLCPTWTAANGQDDITWHEGTINGSVITYTVNTSDHNKQAGTYYTHIYAYDTDNDVSVTAATVQVPASPDALSISDVRISDLDSTGYTVSCKINAPSGISSVKFPTWTEEGDQDDLVWHNGTVSGNVATVRINTSGHNNESGLYNTHIYAYDNDGASVCYEATVTVPEPDRLEIDSVNVTEVTSSGYLVTVVVNDSSLVSKVQFPTWTEKNGQDDITWYSGSVDNDTITCRVKTSEHKNESGLYRTHVYIYDKDNHAHVFPSDIYVPSAGSATAELSGTAHVQNVGWQDWQNGTLNLGTEGRSLRIEALKLKVNSSFSGSITYRTHAEHIGWQDWRQDGALAGTEGQSLRMEAFEIKLTGELAKHYKVQYRAHVQNIGWQDWVEDGGLAGTEGKGLRMEALEIRLIAR